MAALEAVVRAREETAVVSKNGPMTYEKMLTRGVEWKHQALHKAQLHADQEISARAAALQEQECAVTSREQQVSARGHQVGEAV
jgi:hypothetical protein